MKAISAPQIVTATAHLLLVISLRWRCAVLFLCAVCSGFLYACVRVCVFVVKSGINEDYLMTTGINASTPFHVHPSSGFCDRTFAVFDTLEDSVDTRLHKLRS